MIMCALTEDAKKMAAAARIALVEDMLLAVEMLEEDLWSLWCFVPDEVFV